MLIMQQGSYFIPWGCAVTTPIVYAFHAVQSKTSLIGDQMLFNHWNSNIKKAYNFESFCVCCKEHKRKGNVNYEHDNQAQHKHPFSPVPFHQSRVYN